MPNASVVCQRPDRVKGKRPASWGGGGGGTCTRGGGGGAVLALGRGATINAICILRHVYVFFSLNRYFYPSVCRTPTQCPWRFFNSREVQALGSHRTQLTWASNAFDFFWCGAIATKVATEGQFAFRGDLCRDCFNPEKGEGVRSSKRMAFDMPRKMPHALHTFIPHNL